MQVILTACFISQKLDLVGWLPDMDLNHDKQIQSLFCYRYTIGQSETSKVKFWQSQSRLENR
jgi:hypothetical protein